MKLQFRALALAAATLAASGAHAAIELATSGTAGNSSLLFVAVDSNSNIALTVDLGLSMSYFTNSTTWVTELQSASKTWNFATNTTSESGITGISWSAAYDTFKATQAGNDFTWGVIAADAVTGSTVNASNAIAGRGWLATGNATQAEMLNASTSGPTGNGLGNFGLYAASVNNFGTHLGSANGAATTDASNGDAWLPNRMGGNFGGQQTWNYLLANGATSTFQWQQQVVANPVVIQFGLSNATDSLAATPVFWTFDIATDTLVLAVPEPSTYAMLVAGLAAVGFMARRRKA